MASEQIRADKPEIPREIPKNPEADVAARGLSLVHERLNDPDRMLQEGNPLYYSVETPGEHVVVGRTASGNHELAKGDAVSTSASGTFLVYPEGGIARVNDPDSDTHLIIPIKVPASKAYLNPPQS